MKATERCWRNAVPAAKGTGEVRLVGISELLRDLVDAVIAIGDQPIGRCHSGRFQDSGKRFVHVG